MVDRDRHLARLDDRLERVGELRDDLQRERRLAVVGAEARRGVGHVGLRRLAHDPRAEPLQQLLGRREVLDRHHLAVADDHVGVAGDDRRDQLRDVAAVVLVVGVGVDDHVGAELQAGVEPGLEAARQALVVGQPDDVVDAQLARDRDRAIGRAVVDDEPLDGVETVDLTGQVAHRDRQRLLLVQAGDLDDQLHRRGAAQSYHRRREEPPARRGPGTRRARSDDRGRPRAARAPQRPRAAVRLLRRRGLALHQARRRGLPRRQPGLLPEPVGLHVPAAPRLPRRAIPNGGGETIIERLPHERRSGSSRSRAGWRRCCAWSASRRSTTSAGSCGTGGPASSPPPSSASRSCRSRSAASP